jgi:hypothetical protein
MAIGLGQIKLPKDRDPLQSSTSRQNSHPLVTFAPQKAVVPSKLHLVSVKGYQSLDLLSPKPNEGFATYGLEGEPDGVRKTYEMIIKTKGALPDDKLFSFAQIRLMLPEELKAESKKSVKR